MKVYISGKITGDPDYREKFACAERIWSAAGHTVLNPAMLPEGMTQRDYMRICLAMVDCADLLLLLPDWEQSEGARTEFAYTRKAGIPFVEAWDFAECCAWLQQRPAKAAASREGEA